MIAPKRVIRIVNVRVSAAGAKDNLKEDYEELLTKYLKRPAETSVVIFVADELDKRRKMSKLLIENAVAVEFLPLDDGKLFAWAKDKIREAGAGADDNAVRQIVALVGSDVRRLTNEIEKLVTAALPGKIITFALVESLISNAREISNFDLTDYLIAKNKPKALQTLKKILDDGAEPLMLLGLIGYNFHRLFFG